MKATTVTGRDIYNLPVEIDVAQLTWRPGAYGLVFNEDGQILVVENTMNGRMEFPGGGVDIHESFEEAVIREVWEETGLNVEIESFIMMDDEFYLTPSGNRWHTIKCYYRCYVIDGDLRNTILDDEPLINPQWVDPTILNEDNLTIGWEALRIISEQN